MSHSLIECLPELRLLTSTEALIFSKSEVTLSGFIISFLDGFFRWLQYSLINKLKCLFLSRMEYSAGIIIFFIELEYEFT